MAPVLHGIPRSRAARNLWCAKELGIDIERRDVPPGGAGDVNPSGKVPVLDDGDLRMTESLAINLYLAKKAGKLYPQNAADEARAWQWTLWVATEIENWLVAFGRHTFQLPPAERDAAEAAANWAKLPRGLAVIDGHLADRPYLLGERFTIADLNVAGVFLASYMGKVDFSAWPHLVAWLDRCLSRPAAVAVIRMREAG